MFFFFTSSAFRKTIITEKNALQKNFKESHLKNKVSFIILLLRTATLLPVAPFVFFTLVAIKLSLLNRKCKVRVTIAQHFKWIARFQIDQVRLFFDADLMIRRYM